MNPSRMPVAFVGHAAPTVALDPAKGAPWRNWGENLPRPRAVLVVSAHWESAPAALGTGQTLPLIYDFYGFPPALSQVKYPAPAAPPALVARVQDLLGSAQIREDRGWDHGVWTPLVHLLPRADVPVLQVSLPSRDGPQAAFALGARLRPLRAEGVLLLGSGNVTHNLRRMGPDPGHPQRFASEFDEWVKKTLLARQADALLDAARLAPAYRENHPTAEHWLPLVFAMGAAGDDEPQFTLEGWEYSNLSRRAVQWG